MSDFSSLAKSRLRRQIREQRNLSQETHRLLTKRYTQHILSICSQDIKSVAAYLPMPGEPPIRAALEELYRKEIEVLVPIVESKRKLAWVIWSPDIAHPVSSYGIEEPLGTRYGSERFFAADIHLIPALAYDKNGYRLGQGGGFYDSLLSQTNTLDESFIGIIFDEEIVDAVPVEQHDARLSHVITEQGLHSLGSSQIGSPEEKA